MGVCSAVCGLYFGCEHETSNKDDRNTRYFIIIYIERMPGRHDLVVRK